MKILVADDGFANLDGEETQFDYESTLKELDEGKVFPLLLHYYFLVYM